MNKLKQYYFIIIIFIFLIIGFLLLPHYRYSIHQDLISYLSISEKYYNLDFNNAINGIWSPLISILIVPFIVVGFSTLLGFKILQLITGAFILFLLHLLITKLEFRLSAKIIILISTFPILFYFLFLSGTPDLLLSAVMLLYLYLTVIFQSKNYKYSGLILGLIGAISYLVKVIAFPIFVIHFFLMNLIDYLRDKKNFKYYLKKLMFGYVTFFAISLIWIGLLYMKYNILTIGMAGKYNFNYFGPKYQGVQDFRIYKIYPPVNATAISYWEDPSFLKMESWNPFGSIDNFIFQIKIVVKSLFRFLTLIISHNILFVLSLILLIKKIRNRNEILNQFLIFCILYVGFLSVVVIETRYLISVYLLSFIIVGFISHEIFQISSLKKKYRNILIILFLISVSIKPTYSLIKFFNDGEKTKLLSEKINQAINSRNVIGLTNDPLNNDWTNTLFISYLTRSKFYGELQVEIEENKLKDEVKKNKIEYIFCWDRKFPLYENNFELAYEGKFENQNFIVSSLIKSYDARIKNLFSKKEIANDDKLLKIYKVR